MFYKTAIPFIIMLNINVNYCQNRITDQVKFKVKYELTYQRDSTDVLSKRSEIMTLLIGDKYSLFQNENNKYNDSLKTALMNKSNADAQSIVNLALRKRKKMRFRFKILKNTDSVFVLDKIFSNTFFYYDNQKIKWQLLNKEKIIHSYRCQKATAHFGGRDYIAWFTRELPISDGPYKFKGLPGLIVKIYDDKDNYVFDMLSFQKEATEFYFDYSNFPKVSKQEFLKSVQDFKNSYINQLEQRGIILNNPREAKNRIKKNRNNSIELIIE